MLTLILALFIFPLALHALFYASKGHPASYRDADWSSVGMLPPANADHEARLLIFTGRTGRWKGIFSVHSWVVFKPENASTRSRYDVVGWGQPLRSNGWAPDSRWFGNTPRVLVDVRGAEAAALIPKVKSAVASYSYSHFGDYRIWPGPNSNTFTAAVLRAVPELRATLPPNALGKDFRVSKISENFTVQFRAEAFNIMNHPSFQLLTANTQIFAGAALNASAGKIQATNSSPRQLQLALKIVF